MTRILALDPSTVCIAHALLDTEIDHILDYGAFHPGKRDIDDILASAYWWLFDLIRHHPDTPTILAIELPVYHKNVKTLRTLAQLTGALRVATYSWMDETIEVLPAERKTALGLPANMKAKPAKTHILRIVNAMFDLDLTADQHDIADAVAVAVAAQKKLREREMLSDE